VNYFGPSGIHFVKIVCMYIIGFSRTSALLPFSLLTDDDHGLVWRAFFVNSPTPNHSASKNKIAFIIIYILDEIDPLGFFMNEWFIFPIEYFSLLYVEYKDIFQMKNVCKQWQWGNYKLILPVLLSFLIMTFDFFLTDQCFQRPDETAIMV